MYRADAEQQQSLFNEVLAQVCVAPLAVVRRIVLVTRGMGACLVIA